MEPDAGSGNQRLAASAAHLVSPSGDEQTPLVSSQDVGYIYSVVTYFCFRIPDLRQLDEEVCELMGSDVPTIQGKSDDTSEKKGDLGRQLWEAELMNVSYSPLVRLFQSQGDVTWCGITFPGSWYQTRPVRLVRDIMVPTSS